MADTFTNPASNSLPPIAHNYAPKQRPGSSALFRQKTFERSGTPTDLFQVGGGGGATQPLYSSSGVAAADDDLLGSATNLQSPRASLGSRSRPITPGRLNFVSTSRPQSAAVPAKASAAGKNMLIGLIVLIAVAAVGTAIALGVIMTTGT